MLKLMCVRIKNLLPLFYWNIDKFAIQSFQTLINNSYTKKEDYLYYNNKPRDDNKFDKSFPLQCTKVVFFDKPKDPIRMNLKVLLAICNFHMKTIQSKLNIKAMVINYSRQTYESFK